ncbi:spore coat protein GerQ [Bacillus mobilis]|uniref:spore coat protein GerQ n=1 Tax=Bacillus TaxID=1386 RepID=UPI0009BF308F|nr:hypothetical protein CN424_12095 [Bacillus cereus]
MNAKNSYNDCDCSIQDFLCTNIGGQITAVLTYARDSSLGTQSYTGILTAAGTDYFTIEDPASGKLYLLQRIYLNYIEFPNSQTINKPKWCC